MKLVSLYIENFGGLCGYELYFDTGITAVNQPNGFGKTTLAEFIRAMFYGFPRKVKTLEKSKRQKYTPWNGGSFGGNLVFEHEGRRYRIERTFGATPKGDTFLLIDLTSNRKSDRFSAEIGMELFELDSDSFERSIYLPQMQEDGIFTTAGIQAKLSDLVEDSGDVGNYDKAIALLRAKRGALIPYRGSGGSIAQTVGKITDLQLRLDLARQRHGQLMELQESFVRTERQLAQTRAALEQVQQKQSAAAEQAAQIARRGEYERLCRSYEQTCMQLDALFDAYPGGFPELSRLSDAEETADSLAALEKQLADLESDIRSEKCRNGQIAEERALPSREELNICREKCETFAALQRKLHEAEAALTRQMQLERETIGKPQMKASSAGAAALAVSVLAIAAGIVLIYFRQLFYGAVATGTGIVAMAAAAAMLLSGRRRRCRQQSNWNQRIAAAQESIAALRGQSEQCHGEILRFLADSGIDVQPQQFQAGLTRLERRIEMHGRIKQLEAASARLRAELEHFLQCVGQQPEGDLRRKLRQMRDALQEYRMLGERKRELSDRLAQMERETPRLSSAPLIQAEDPQTLAEQLRSLRRDDTSLTETLLRQEHDIRMLQAQTVQIPSLQEQLAHLQAQLAQERENVRILDETMAFLQQARESLATAYLGTIRSCFDCYLGQLEKSTGEKYLIDTELQVQLERMGQSRELAYFSAGQTDLVMLCMRLALADALFKQQQVFVILDDPFVNLDDAHTAQACKLLHTLAERRQILYLTCHSSRMI